MTKEELLKNAKWSDERKCYITPDGRTFDEDGDEYAKNELDNGFNDVGRLRLQQQYGYYKAAEMLRNRR